MDNYSRNRLTGWAVTFLVVLNLVLLVTIWYPRLFPGKKTIKDPVKKPVKDIKVTAPPSNRQHPGPDRQRRKEREDRIFKYIEKVLNFTDQQVSEFRALREEHFESTKKINQELHRIRFQLMEQLTFDNPDSERAMQLAAEIGKKHQELERQTFLHFMALMNVCKGDQKKKFKSMFREIMRQLRPPEHGPPGGSGHPIGSRGNGHPPPQRGEQQGPPGQGTRPQPPEHGGQQPPDPPGEFSDIDSHVEHHIRRMTRDLNLTQDQVAKIKAILKKTIGKKEALRQSNTHGHDRHQAHQAIDEEEDRLIEAVLTEEQITLYRQHKKNRPQRPGPPNGQF